MALAHERVAQALNDAYAAGYIGNNILGTDFSIDIVLHWGAGAYVVGEETALIESLEGERGMPRLKPPFFPAAVGLYGMPTIVNNVETLSNLPFILARDLTMMLLILAGSPTVLWRLWRERAVFGRALARRRLDAARPRHHVSPG